MISHIYAFEQTKPGAAVVLVASDVAAVGLNLQFAADLIFYDLPWRPRLAEQWIGRLDRLGRRADDLHIHALTHPATTIHALLELYEQIGLFGGGYRGAPDEDENVSKLIERADSGQLSWREARDQAAVLLQQEIIDEDEPAQRALDMEPLEPSSVPSEALRHARLLRAFESAGLRVAQVDEDGRAFHVSWPVSATGVDSVALPQVRAALRPQGRVGGRPDQTVEFNKHSPSLRLATQRLGAGPWRRGWATDLLTPRHPLVTDARAELMADPTLPLGLFKISGGGAARGRYFLALCRKDPAAGALCALWSCEAAARQEEGDPLEDSDLAMLWRTAASGLRRGLSAEAPPLLLPVGWRLYPGVSAGSRAAPLDEGTVAALVEAIPAGSALPLKAAGGDLLDALRALERPPVDIDDGTLQAVGRALRATARYARLAARRLVEEREARLEATPDISAMRGIREKHARELKLTRVFLERLCGIDQFAEAAAREVLRPRALAAVVVEVDA
jgi:hypothetical protein